MLDYKLFLDDIRFPVDQGWIIARTYDEAVNVVKTLGIPQKISFDHDLGLNSLSGFDFAKFIVEYDMLNDEIDNTFVFVVHSANPVGSENIKGLLNNYIKFKNEQASNPSV
jgi:hypothetical protein